MIAAWFTRRRVLFGIAIGATIVAIVATGAVATHSSPEASQRRPSPSCPPRSALDQARTHRLLELLENDAESQSIARRFDKNTNVCFGDFTEGMAPSDDVFLLPEEQADSANAARLVHLMLHRLDGLDIEHTAMRGVTLPCGEFVQRVMESERRAHVLEAKVRERYGLDRLPDVLAELEEAYQTNCQRIRARLDDPNR